MTMIETLISIVIIAIGLLGYAGLLLQSNKANLTSYQRSQATLLAYDIADAMRANRSSALAGQYNIAMGSAASSGSAVSTQDLVRWKSNLSKALPSGDGSIQVNGTGSATITIQWSNTSQVHAGEDSSTTFVTQTRI
ncbi:type IV pilus modification protein PilV [Dechloromonas sp. XY25]|uniref:Type IV pilus modification protein PilV n=2 Tax=Dechloromonas hankyongensis TaxID=2908002 RepID=A0ABS9K571_9RHOO|nr:type IV pilus modification protein PilV [Dechloromonas hankyongensis]